jgi:hypothetical protein
MRGLETFGRTALIAEIRRLRAGIRAHRDNGHDLCWENFRRRQYTMPNTASRHRSPDPLRTQWPCVKPCCKSAACRNCYVMGRDRSVGSLTQGHWPLGPNLNAVPASVGRNQHYRLLLRAALRMSRGPTLPTTETSWNLAFQQTLSGFSYFHVVGKVALPDYPVCRRPPPGTCQTRPHPEHERGAVNRFALRPAPVISLRCKTATCT